MSAVIKFRINCIRNFFYSRSLFNFRGRNNFIINNYPQVIFCNIVIVPFSKVFQRNYNLRIFRNILSVHNFLSVKRNANRSIRYPDCCIFFYVKRSVINVVVFVNFCNFIFRIDNDSEKHLPKLFIKI